MNYSEKGVTIRQPSTANLMIDSVDRGNQGTWGNFTISKKQSLFNGFFTRLGVTEVVLEWCQPNIIAGYNDVFSITVAGTPYTVTVPEGLYTVEDLLDKLVTLLDAAAIPSIAATWQIDVIDGLVYLLNTNSINFVVNITPLTLGLGIAGNSSTAGAVLIDCPDIRIYRYIDITSAQLTYNQDLKDASTAEIVRDVLCRWYFAWDTPPALDGYGFPILMGYTKFVVRRLYNPPKQIKWDTSQPVGQISFEVYDDDGLLITLPYDNNFLMTVQASEN